MDQTYEDLRKQLLTEKADLETRLSQNDEYQLSRSMRDSDGELSHVDNHPADTASTLYEREKDIALHEHDHKHLEEIEEALQRMEEGIYGVCQTCGQPIDIERLKAIPTAAHCIEHERTPKFTSFRPVEEDVFTSFGQFNFDGRNDETEFDAEDAYQAVARYNELPSVVYDEYDAEEARGFVEPIEGFIITDMNGKAIEDSIDVNRNRTYEDYIDNGEGEGMIWEDEIIMPDETEEEL